VTPRRPNRDRKGAALADLGVAARGPLPYGRGSDADRFLTGAVRSTLLRVTQCFFVSDLHGRTEYYRKLFEAITAERPAAVFLGGDLLPSGLHAFDPAVSAYRDFIADFLVAGFAELRTAIGSDYPRVFLILGNDDGRNVEPVIQDAAAQGVWEYVHGRKTRLDRHDVYGYSYVPPSPFLLKDWERYDVSRHVDHGCVSPEEGMRSVPVDPLEARYRTIRDDLEELTGAAGMDDAILLFHAPPYDTPLDRAALDGRTIDHVRLDVHVGSIAIRRFIEARQPLITLHGHIHESGRLTGAWRTRLGRTHCFSAAHDGPELSLVRFDPGNPQSATREHL